MTVAVGAVVASASPAVSGEVRSSSACTHNFYGTGTTRPAVCIEIHGRGTWADRVVARWPGGGSQLGRWGVLHEGNGKSLHGDVRAYQKGDDLVAEWKGLRLAEGKACVSFTGLESWACQDVIA
ncbi:hypothetical protein AB0D10_42840 [Kitasatospora sp. NPDC048545]|uniref:hypothetical protein n=1 Tax=Kitasatospora sp. NPDC048545 TaxID=3157208 RepID=UPI0033D80F61